MDPDILIVVATVVAVFGFCSTLAGWVNGARPVVAMLSLAGGLAALAYVHLVLRPDGLVPRDIPDAFIHVLAMIL